ncbi:MAG TPA: heliorhodopsin HeR [Candidatus Saccharimonadales bacterium]|nr:heliorhodopsin HeR [Candidatus Saccharimonadales bacterium]
MTKKTTSEKKNKTTAISAEQFQSLRKWNLWAGLLLAVQAIAIVIIGTSRSYPLTTNFLTVDTLASEATKGQSLAAATRHLWDMPLAWGLGGVLLLFAIANLVAALWARKWYEQRLVRGLNDLRWLSFAVGGAGLLATVGLLVGIYDLTLLLAVKAFMVAGCLGVMAGGIMRQAAGDKETPLSHVVCGVGTACIVAALVIIGITTGGAVLYDGHIPAFVYGILATTGVAFLALGGITHLRIVRKGIWANPLTVERAFLVLSFLAVSAVTWQVYAGALKP